MAATPPGQGGEPARSRSVPGEVRGGRGGARRHWRRVHEILIEDQPYTYLLYRPGLHVLHSRFRGVEIGPRGLFANAEAGGSRPRNGSGERPCSSR